MSKANKISLWISQGIFLLTLPWSSQLVFYLHPIALGVLWFCVTSVVYLSVYGLRREKLKISYPTFLVVFSFYSLGLLILLFFRPSEQSYDHWNLVPLKTIWLFLASSENLLVATYNLLANIGLFIPLGLFFMLHREKWHLTNRKLLIIPLLVIVGIETLQFATSRGSLDIDDLILNGIGVLLGYLLFPFVMRIVEVKVATQKTR